MEGDKGYKVGGRGHSRGPGNSAAAAGQKDSRRLNFPTKAADHGAENFDLGSRAPAATVLGRDSAAGRGHHAMQTARNKTLADQKKREI